LSSTDARPAAASTGPATEQTTPAADPAAPTVGALADRTNARVGDAITLTVTAVGPRTTPVNLPAGLELAPFSLLDRRDSEKDIGDGRMSRSFVLTIAAYEPGEVSIPAVQVTYLAAGGEPRSVRSQPIPIKITSLIANEPEPQLKDNAGPVTVMEENRIPLYVAGGVGAAALGGLVALVIRRRILARRASRPAPPPRPPHEIALERLDRLAAAGFPADGDFRAFYFELSEIVRGYLGPRYAFDSVELTTEELVDELRRRAPRGLVLAEVEGWLASCDLVKFAKVAPTSMEARGALETGIRLVESTRPRLAPAPGGKGGGGGEAASAVTDRTEELRG
jgi:hypothetical protein